MLFWIIGFALLFTNYYIVGITILLLGAIYKITMLKEFHRLTKYYEEKYKAEEGQ